MASNRAAADGWSAGYADAEEHFKARIVELEEENDTLSRQVWLLNKKAVELEKTLRAIYNECETKTLLAGEAKAIAGRCRAMVRNTLSSKEAPEGEE